MSARRHAPGDPPAEPRTQESWLRQRARRKLAAARGEDPEHRATTAADAVEPAGAAGHAPPPLPPLETLDADSDYSGFLHPRVDAALRRTALRKLFRSAKFNVVDGLDDYAEDYRGFAALGDTITADMRLRAEREARRLADAESATDTDRDAAGAAPAADEPGDRTAAANRVTDRTPGNAQEPPDGRHDDPPTRV